MKLEKIFLIFILFFSNNIIGQDNTAIINSNCNQVVSGFLKNRDTDDFVKEGYVKLYQGEKFIANTLTNSKGEYSFNVKCTTSYTLLAGKTYYTTSQKEFTTSNERDIGLKFSLYLETVNSKCDQILNGRIIDELTNEPIKNVTVLVNDMKGNIIATDLTNPYGNYHFNLPCKKLYKIIISKEDYITQTEELEKNNINNKIHRKDIILKSNTCTRLIKGQVINSETFLPIKIATIKLLKNNKELNSSYLSSDKEFKIQAKCNSNYKIKVSSKGFKETTISINEFDKNSILNTLKIGLNPIKEQIATNLPEKNITDTNINSSNETKVLQPSKSTNSAEIFKPIIDTNNIEFDLNDSKINRKIAVELNKLVAIMKFSPQINLQLESHTDSRGPDQYNLDLTEARAQSMVSYIISKGIDSNRVSGKGYGETELLNECDNETDCNESLHEENKRVEYIIITNGIN